MPDVTQENIEDKLALFLNALGEGEKFNPGICNGFAFMNFRADVRGLEDKNLARMQKLANMDNNAIMEMAIWYKYYKKARTTLLETEPILSLNLTIEENNKKLAELKNQTAIAQLKEKIKTLRAERDALVNAMLEERFPNELEKIHEAENIYIYLNTMLAAFDPDKYNYVVEGYGQKAYVEMLQLLAPIDAEESELKVAKAFEIAFNFSEKELIKLFSDERIIHRGDFIALGSSTHAMYLSYRDGVFRLFDPGPITIIDNTPDVLVAAIKDRFFTRFGRDASYLPIGISIFEGLSSEKAKVDRPEAASLIESMLAARGSQPNIDAYAWDGTSAVHMAAKFGHVSVIKLLEKANADLKARNNEGETPVYVAAQNNQSEVVEMLAETGRVSLNTWNDIGNTPLMVAARCGHVKTVEVLAKYGAKLNVHQRLLGDTAAVFAAKFDHAMVIKTLFDSKADLEKHDFSGRTPLHVAIEKSHFSCIRTLIYCGARLDIPDKTGKTPLNYADAKTRLFIEEQVKLKQSFDQLQRLVFHMLRPVHAELNHTTEDMPYLHLNVYGCSPTELAALRGILKKFGIEAQQDGKKLVVMNIDPDKVSTPRFVHDFQASKSILINSLKSELESINRQFEGELASIKPDLNKLTFHFTSYEQATQEKMIRLTNDFLLKLHRYVELSLDDAKAKIDVYRQYRQWPVIAEHRKGGLKAIARTDAQIEIDGKIQGLQAKMHKR